MRVKDEKLIYTTYLPQEKGIAPSGYDRALQVYEYIRVGDRRSIPEARQSFDAAVVPLSSDPLTNDKYRFVQMAALAADYAGQGGLTTEDACNLRDLYVQQLDGCASREDLMRLLQQMVTQMTDRVADVQRTGQLALIMQMAEQEDGEEELSPAAQNQAVKECMDYIYYHLYERIYLKDLAEHVRLSPGYLSKLFHRKRGMTIQNYIRHRRLEAAASMLLYSDYSVTEIAEILAFSSRSHLIRAFREEYGVTPGIYRSRKGEAEAES